MSPDKLIVLLLFFLLKSSEEADHKECIPRSTGTNRIVCVCNATYCDNISQPPTVLNGHYLAYTSSEAGLRFQLQEGEFQSESGSKVNYTTITIDPNERYQTIIGWGGAFTDATGIHINSLSPTAADYLLKSYFSEDGLEYNLCRVPIGGTDFSTRGYSYDDGEEDPDLLNFKLAPEDYQYKIPLIKAARNLTKGNLDLFAAAWAAPIWMKHNGEYNGPDILKRRMHQAWANYHIKFLEAYKAEGLNFWGITTGNEPFATGLRSTKIPAAGWFPWQMGNWIAEQFGPAIRNSEFSSVKILTVDDQLPFYPWLINLILKNEKAKDYIDGFGLHWYLNRFVPRSLLTRTHNKYPDKFILATEACTGSSTYQSDEKVALGDWSRAQAYAKDIIDDLKNWVTGWIDWNMALDLTGGPTYIGNNVDSPIIVNASAGEFYKQPMYYALGHFSKFIPKGSERVSVTQSNNGVDVVAFNRPDNQTAVVILNGNTYDAPIKLTDPVNGEIIKTVPGQSIITLLY